MSMKAITAIVIGGVAIIVCPLLGWLIAVAFPWIFQNSTGGYPTAAAETIANNLQLIFIGLGLLVGVVIMIFGVIYAVKQK